MTEYKRFEKHILRTPINPLCYLKDLNISLDFFIEQSAFLQAIKLASPSLFDEFSKWQKQGLKNKKEEEHLLFSMLKYYVRSSSRCTPFGLFAGLSLGEISNESKLTISTIDKHKAHTRLDMNYLCSLIQDLEKIPELRDQLTYFVNNSLYTVHNKIRYIEYNYFNSKRHHQISAADNNEYLQKVIDRAKTGATINELVDVLICDDISYEDAFAYINQLIDNQVFISNLDPTVSGDELHDFLIQRLDALSLNENKTLDILKHIKKEIELLDKTKIGHASQNYFQIAQQLKALDTKFEEKFLFQTDLVINTEENSISSKIIDDIYSGLKVLNKLTSKPDKTKLSSFRDAFLERYEEREIPLHLALDIETGIGYLQNTSQNAGDNTPLVDNIALPQKPFPIDKSYEINWDSKQSLLLQKYIEAIQNNTNEIVLNDEDLKDYTENWDDLPSTFPVMAELVNIDGKEKIIVGSAGGSSAINLLGRFAHADEELNEFINDIAHKEEELNPNIELAEIVHLPESRAGNILARPVFRKYEIPYLAQSAVEKENQIPIEDLMVSVRRNKIILRSKRLNKEIKPHLSNAHNFSGNSLPVYHFLADMQSQNQRGGVFFSWGSLENQYNFLPRVSYKNIIFSTACWIIKQTEIEDIVKLKEDSEILNRFLKLKQKRKLPKHVALADGDNELYINLEEILSIKMLFSLVSKRPSFKLKEFLFLDGNPFVKDKEGKAYSNQFIFSFYKDIKGHK